MIKKSKISEFIDEKVARLLDVEFSKLGFRYLKSKRRFIKQEKCFDQIISFYSRVTPLSFNDETEQVFLDFGLSTYIESTDFDKWYFKKFNEKSNFTIPIDHLTSNIELSLDVFNSDDFFNPSALRDFKQKVSLSLMGGNRQYVDFIPFDEFIRKIPFLISNLTAKCDIMHLFSSSRYYFEHIYLLFYGGYSDFGQEQLDKLYNKYIDEVNEKRTISETESSGSIAHLD